MLRVLVASLLLSFSVQASHLDTVCKSAITNPPIFADGYIARISYDGRSVIETMEGKEIFASSERIHSILTQGQKIWALTYSQLLELSLDGSLINRHAIDMNHSMSLAGDVLIIIRSGSTITALDTKKGIILWNSFMADVPGGLAVSSAFDGKNIQMAFASAHEEGFTGIATIEPTTGNVIKKIPYLTRRYGVIAPDAIAHWSNEDLILNNGGWIHVISGKQLSASKPIKPRWVAHPIQNSTNPHYMTLRGDFFFEGKTLIGCGSYRELTGNDWNLISALFRVQL